MPDNFRFDTYRGVRPRKNLITKVEKAFSREGLARICEMPERAFADAYEMQTVKVDQRAPEDFYAFRDNGSDILAVAHLDTVGLADERACHFLDTEGGPVVYSRALDDRLGAYIILELLPALGITSDVLLTVGEETGRSTAKFFEPPKNYNYMIEFDRGGTDVVMYDYEDDDTYALVREAGAVVGRGSFSDICYLEHLGVKGFNWGVGYQDYHGPRAHAWLDDTICMVAKYLKFHKANADTTLVHMPDPRDWWKYSDGFDDVDDTTGALHNEDDLVTEYPSLAQITQTIEAMER